jgi:hypothetical protein
VQYVYTALLVLAALSFAVGAGYAALLVLRPRPGGTRRPPRADPPDSTR